MNLDPIHQVMMQRDLIYEYRWDVLIVLDACRADAFEDVALPRLREWFSVTEYRIVESAGSCTQEWFVETFTKPMPDVVYVSANPWIGAREYSYLHTPRKYDPRKLFHKVIEVWDRGWMRWVYAYTVPPFAVLSSFTGAAVRYRGKRFIVHFLQPHFPNPSDPELSRYFCADKLNPDRDLWSALRRGELSRDRVYRSYLENLEWVTYYVRAVIELARKLLSAGTVVVTADHGEAFGEEGVYDHPPGTRIPVLINVPWCVVALR